MTNWQTQLAATLNAVPTGGVQRPGNPLTGGVTPELEAIVTALQAAGAAFDKRSDGFAQGKGNTCRDIAHKALRFGGFASEKQKEFALKLISWSQPRAVPAATPEVTSSRSYAPVAEYPKLFAVLQSHAQFHVTDKKRTFELKISRKNGESLCWVMWNGVCVARIENARVLFGRKLVPADRPRIEALLQEFEAAPLVAAVKYGRLSGVCCSCGADLTDPKSVAAGIGPICAKKF